MTTLGTEDEWLELLKDRGNPAGMIIYTASSIAPAGYLKADGTEISRTDYAELFAVIGTIYGDDDGKTTFNSPDLRGDFLRGFDDGREVDAGRVLLRVSIGNKGTSPTGVPLFQFLISQDFA